ncbi:MAG: hisE [Oscillospiraceae bacterium]|nr:hisE [Oscillospiraceae bacterium]
MINDTLKGLFEVVKQRKTCKEEGSYTCYLFEQGQDKILKKCGEECSEMIIASKNDDPQELKNEMCDLIYHMMVLMAEKGIELEEVMEILEARRQKIGNLKNFHRVDHES